MKPGACPFCQGVDTILDDNDKGRLYWVECTDCLATGPRKDSGQVAIMGWNFPTERVALFKKMAEE